MIHGIMEALIEPDFPSFQHSIIPPAMTALALSI
jgi:hypothetical protein